MILDPGPGVFCDNAMTAFIVPLTPKADKERKKRWLKHAMSELNKVGIVGAGDAGIRPTDIAILEEMADAAELTLRAKVMLECPERNTYCPEEAEKLQIVSKADGLGGNMLMLGGVKLFADGALGSRGAALLEPYDDDTTTSGTMLINGTDLMRVVKQVSNKFQSLHYRANNDHSGTTSAFKSTSTQLVMKRTEQPSMLSRTLSERTVMAATTRPGSESNTLRSS